MRPPTTYEVSYASTVATRSHVERVDSLFSKRYDDTGMDTSSAMPCHEMLRASRFNGFTAKVPDGTGGRARSDKEGHHKFIIRRQGSGIQNICLNNRSENCNGA